MTTGRINQITIFASSCCREYAYTRVYSGPAAPFTPSHTTPTTADEKNNQKHEHGRRAQLKARFKNPCKRFFFYFFIFDSKENQTAEALPASKRTPTDSAVRDHRRAPLDFPLADSTPVTRGEPFETQGDQPVIYHLSLAHRKAETIFLRHQQASHHPNPNRSRGETPSRHSQRSLTGKPGLNT